MPSMFPLFLLHLHLKRHLLRRRKYSRAPLVSSLVLLRGPSQAVRGLHRSRLGLGLVAYRPCLTSQSYAVVIVSKMRKLPLIAFGLPGETLILKLFKNALIV